MLVGLRRIGLLLALLTAGGCTRAVPYAVIAPNVSANDGRSCFRQCQLVRATGTKEYLACLNTCTDVRIVSDSGCEAVPIDASQYACTTEHKRKFSAGLAVVWVLAVVLSVLFVAASLPEL